MPQTAARLVRQAVQSRARGNAVRVPALPQELTIQRAAELLALRPEDAVRLIDQGELAGLPAEAGAERRAALTELTRLSEEMALADLDQPDPPAPDR